MLDASRRSSKRPGGTALLESRPARLPRTLSTTSLHARRKGRRCDVRSALAPARHEKLLIARLNSSTSRSLMRSTGHLPTSPFVISSARDSTVRCTRVSWCEKRRWAARCMCSDCAANSASCSAQRMASWHLPAALCSGISHAAMHSSLNCRSPARMASPFSSHSCTARRASQWCAVMASPDERFSIRKSKTCRSSPPASTRPLESPLAEHSCGCSLPSCTIWSRSEVSSASKSSSMAASNELKSGTDASIFLRPRSVVITPRPSFMRTGAMTRPPCQCMWKCPL
mmetsp:Transcript_39241/g.123734  ORF Transcript_39241/g.123734 Transcript_39241/m.123734 type:complete len:285 (+) Transcript_39241:2222-3076(+)